MEPTLPDPAAALLPPVAALTRGFVQPAEGPDRARATAAADVRRPTQTRQGLRVGGLRLAIRYDEGSELAELPPVYRLPNTPPWYLGVANLRGALVPVFDLAARLGLEREPQRKPMLLVLGHGDEAAGVLIDGLPQHLRLGDEDRCGTAPVPPGLDDCTGEAFAGDERPWTELRVEALLARLLQELSGPNAA